MTFPAGRTLLGETAGLKTAGTGKEVFIKGTKSTVATSAAVRPESAGLGEAFTGLGRRWQALFGRKPFPSLAGACRPAGHQHVLPACGWGGLGTLPCFLAGPGWGCCRTPASGEQQASWVGGHEAQTPLAHSRGRKPPQQFAWWPGGYHRQGPGRGVGLESQPHALSMQQGRGGERWAGDWGAGPHLTQGCARSIPALALSCQAAGPQPSKGAALLCRTLPNSSLSTAAAATLHGLGAGDPCSVPFPGLLGPARGHRKSHPAIRGSRPSATSSWSWARSCEERGRSKGKGCGPAWLPGGRSRGERSMQGQGHAWAQLKSRPSHVGESVALAEWLVLLGVECLPFQVGLADLGRREQAARSGRLSQPQGPSSQPRAEHQHRTDAREQQAQSRGPSHQHKVQWVKPMAAGTPRCCCSPCRA